MDVLPDRIDLTDKPIVGMVYTRYRPNEKEVRSWRGRVIITEPITFCSPYPNSPGFIDQVEDIYGRPPKWKDPSKTTRWLKIRQLIGPSSMDRSLNNMSSVLPCPSKPSASGLVVPSSYMKQLTCEIPANETGRLGALRRYEILDSPPDGSFDRITAICARLFKVPVALVTLVDEDRIWFKSRFGLDADQVDREAGLCASAILNEEVYVVTNAAMDPRTLANPLVAGAMGLRFYAAAPLRTHDGYSLGNLCIIDKEPRDLSADQQATLKDLAAVVMDEMELRIAALQAIQKKDEFMALASHELRTPLSTAKAFIELTEMSLEEQAAAGELPSYIGKAKKAIDQTSSLIADLLDISKIQHGSMVMRLEETEFDPIIKEVVESIQPVFPSHRIDLRGSTGRRVTVDRDRLQQLVINLLTNAVKYSPGKDLVEVSLRTDRNEVRLSVKDQGIGIAPEHIDKIFDRFHREKMVERRFQGLGVGLYIAADIAQRHGGKLTVESVPDQGSTFHLFLPAIN